MDGVKTDIKQWVTLSDYDLETARHMQRSGRYLYVLFCCQQSLEKRLKAFVVKVTEEFPPRTHDLVKLALLSKLPLDEDKENFLRKLANYYIGTRYPEEVSRLAKDVTKQLAGKYLKYTEEFVKWLDLLMK